MDGNETNTQAVKTDPEIKNLHTYSSDMAEASRTNNVSVIKVALAEDRKNQQEEAYKKAEGSNTTKIILSLGGILLVVLGFAVYYFVFTKKQTDNTPQTIVKPIETFVPYDTLANIDVTNVVSNADLAKAITTEVNKTDVPAKIKAIILNQTTGAVTTPITAKAFLTLMDTTMPQNLVQSLASGYMIGSYQMPAGSVDRTPHVFLMFEPKDYNTAYASMLVWENTMLGDVFPLFNIDVSGDNKSLLETPWKDIVINNQDARALYDTTGKPILYYVFIGKDYLVITDSQDAIKEIMARLITKNTKPL